MSELVVGQYPVSIATSLSLERLMGIHPGFTGESPYLFAQVQNIYFNIQTLARNILNGFEGSLEEIPPNWQKYLVNEVTTLHALIPQLSGGLTQARFYLPSYRDIHRKYPKAKIREINTVKQKLHHTLTNEAIKFLLEHQDVLGFEIPQSHAGVRGQSEAAMIFTHIPLDLVEARGFSRIYLLESHTGEVKGRERWHTKLYNGKELTRIPLTVTTLLLLGDTQMFSPYSPKVKQALIALANQKHWNAQTSDDRIIANIRTDPSPILFDAAKTLGIV